MMKQLILTYEYVIREEGFNNLLLLCCLDSETHSD